MADPLRFEEYQPASSLIREFLLPLLEPSR
jgi:hypothetical protein